MKRFAVKRTPHGNHPKAHDFRTEITPFLYVAEQAMSRITEAGVETEGGTVREVDALILATGYEMYGHYSPVSYDVLGRGGVNLETFWAENGFQAYEGVAVPGFPNFFMFCGPTSQGGYTYFKHDQEFRPPYHTLPETCEKSGGELY